MIEKGENFANRQNFQGATDSITQALYFLKKVDLDPGQLKNIETLINSQRIKYEKALKLQNKKKKTSIPVEKNKELKELIAVGLKAMENGEKFLQQKIPLN